MPNTTKSAKTVNPCICSQFANLVTGERIACFSTTKGLFAPGHDAKLKGLLIRAGVKDQMVSDGIVGEFTSAEISGRFGFYSKVMEGIRKGKAAKAARTSEDEAAKAMDLVIKAKVGRWEYFGVVLAAGDGTPVFRYTDKKGVSQDTMKFSRV